MASRIARNTAFLLFSLASVGCVSAEGVTRRAVPAALGEGQQRADGRDDGRRDAVGGVAALAGDVGDGGGALGVRDGGTGRDQRGEQDRADQESAAEQGHRAPLTECQWLTVRHRVPGVTSPDS